MHGGLGLELEGTNTRQSLPGQTDRQREVERQRQETKMKRREDKSQYYTRQDKIHAKRQGEDTTNERVLTP